jgi:GMP synthase-like glutamine amidotransferase
MENNKILVVNDYGSYGRAIEGLGDIVTRKSVFFNNPQEFCLVMFTGGEDVDPSFYNETSPEGFCGSNKRRDIEEKEVFDFALEHGIRMTGICRGAQFINVMSGGRMMHHIKGHGGYHGLASNRTEKIIEVTSTHHQMIIPPVGGIITAWSEDKRSDIYIGDKDEPVDYIGPEVEGVLIPSTKCCGVQYHPEYMPKDSDGYKFYYRMMYDFLNIDIGSDHQG